MELAPKLMTRLLSGLLVVAFSASPCWAAGLQLSIHDGTVSIDAQDVTIRQILTEWARIGKTRIVNVERLSGGPITIKFDAVPEKQALDIILRAVPGYIAAPRETLVADASVYETILIMATTTAVAALRPPNPGYAGLQSGFPGGGPNMTALRPAQPLLPGQMPDLPDPADDQQTDPAVAAAAAAGLMPVPAPPVGPYSGPIPAMMMPGAISNPASPATPTPTNPWNAPAGTAQPSLAPPPAPPQQNPMIRTPVPALPDR